MSDAHPMATQAEVQQLFNDWFDAEFAVMMEYTTNVKADTADLYKWATARAEILGLVPPTNPETRQDVEVN